MDSLQFINLPCSVSQSSNENETKVIETETTRRRGGGGPCRTKGGPIYRKSKQIKIAMSFKHCAKQSDKNV